MHTIFILRNCCLALDFLERRSSLCLPRLANSMIVKIERKRIVYVGLVMATILLGMLSRSELVALPDFIATYSGDTIWALMVFFLGCAIFPKWRTRHIAIAALLFAFGIEFSQFYRSPWIDAIRQTTIGGLILGFGFKSSDLICYAVGVAIGTVIDVLLVTRVRWTQVSPAKVRKSGRSRKSG